MWATSVPILVFLGLCSRVTPDVRNRRQTKASLNASALWGGGIINNTFISADPYSQEHSLAFYSSRQEATIYTVF